MADNLKGLEGVIQQKQHNVRTIEEGMDFKIMFDAKTTQTLTFVRSIETKNIGFSAAARTAARSAVMKN
jgi:hypothetical protein